MNNDDRFVSKGRFKGKRIEFASTGRIDEFAHIANEFMDKIFQLGPGDYLISDESDIRDFAEFGSSDTSQIWDRIRDAYGIEQPDVRSGRLVDIFAEISLRRNVQ